MGCYVNPPSETKEQFLRNNGRVISVNEAKIANGEYPVCLISGNFFTSAAVAYSNHELAVLADVADPQPKVWYMVEYTKLLEVSDIIDYVAEFTKD